MSFLRGFLGKGSQAQVTLTKKLLTVDEQKSAPDDYSDEAAFFADFQEKYTKKPEHVPSSLQLDANKKFGEALTLHVDSVGPAFKKITQFITTPNLNPEDSDFEYLKKKEKNFNMKNEASRAEIKKYLEDRPLFLQAYRDFDKALTDLENAKVYFNKTPFCNEKSFLNAYKTFQLAFKDKKNPQNEAAVDTILSQYGGKYHEFVKNALAVYDGTAAPIQILAKPGGQM